MNIEISGMRFHVVYTNIVKNLSIELDVIVMLNFEYKFK